MHRGVIHAPKAGIKPLEINFTSTLALNSHTN